MKYLKNFKFWILTFAFIYTVFGFIIVPWFLTNKLSPILKDSIGINLQIEKASFNPYSFVLELQNVLLQDLDGHPVLSFEKTSLNYTLLGLLQKTLLFKQLSIQSPKFFTRIYTNGKINLENIIPQNFEQINDSEQKESKLPAIVLEQLIITGGNVVFSDLRGKKPFHINLGPYNFNAHDISTKEGELNAHSFKTQINNDGELFWEGGMTLVPLSLYGEINISNLKLSDIYDYALPDIDARLQSADLSLHVPYQIDLSKNVQATIKDANLTLANIQITSRDHKSKLINISRTSLDGLSLNYPQQDITLEKFTLENSKIMASLDKNYQLNLVKSFLSESKTETQDRNDTKPWNFLLKDAAITKTYISFNDMSLDIPTMSELKNISLHVKNISSQKTLPIEYKLSSTLNKDSQILIDGNLVQEPLVATSNLDLQGLHVKEFIEYIKPYIPVKLNNADINLQANILANLSKNKNIKVQASTEIKKFSISDTNSKKLITWDTLNINNLNLEWPKQNVEINNVTLEKLFIYTSMDKNYELNLIKAFVPQSSNTKSQESVETKPWGFLVKSADINQANIAFIDGSLEKPLTTNLKKTSLHVKNISSQKTSPITYKLSSILNKSTNINLNGNVIQEPLKITSDIDLKSLHVKEFVRYIEPYVNFKIQKADINVKAKLKADLSKKADITVNANTYINNLTIDGDNNEKLLAWKSLDINGIKYASNPAALEIKKLKLTKPYIRAHISKDGSTNFSNLVKESNESNTTTEKTSNPMKIKIGPMDLVNGTSDFSDFSLPLAFRTNIHDLNGHFSTLDFQTTTPSLLKLSGKIDKYGYTDIQGTLSPFNIKENAQVKLLFKNIDLNSLTPYSGKFVGYKIKSGKLSMDLNYDIKKSKLIGANKINIDTLTLGDTVESPDAVNLPLGLAIALLKDSQGQIDIDMPVAGDMDNPEFSYGGVIWRAVGNMITGIVTAPFKFLGAMMGIDGDALKAIDFDKGSFVITSTEHEKLENLQKILGKRPGIKLNIIGTHDEVVDTRAIQEEKFALIMKEKLSQIKVKKDNTKVDTYGIVLKELSIKQFGEDAYDKTKESLLKDKDGKKIKLDIIAFNTLLENKLVVTIPVPKEELIALANQRAASIKDILINEYKIDETRIQILAPATTEAKRERWVESALEISI